MAYKILVTETAKKQLEKLDRQHVKRIAKKLHEISDNPFLYVTKLADMELYKLRVGDYRVLMTIKQNDLFIIEIGHRRNVYK